MGQSQDILTDSILVSAIITTHNRLELLKRAVESVYKQTYSNIELIVVDDNSTDGTKEWCMLQGFKYIHIPAYESRGGNYARNLGIKMSHGRYVAFLDDDDYWIPEKNTKQISILESTGSYVVNCSRRLELVDKDGEIEFKCCPLSSNYKGDLSRRILYQISVLTSALMVKKEALMKVGYFDEQCWFWQEYELSIRLAQLPKPFELINDELIVYRIDMRDKQRLTNKYNGWQDNVEYIYKKHESLYGQLNLLERLRVKVLFWRESYMRAESAGLNKLAKHHKRLEFWFNIPFRIYDKIRTKVRR